MKLWKENKNRALSESEQQAVKENTENVAFNDAEKNFKRLKRSRFRTASLLILFNKFKSLNPGLCTYQMDRGW